MGTFDHERLRVYQAAIGFVAWSHEVLAGLEGTDPAKGHLERAATSVPLNIAEGNGKFSVRDRCRFPEIARGSALECAAGLDVLAARQKLSGQECRKGKELLRQVVAMLTKMISSLSERIAEEPGGYGLGMAPMSELEQEQGPRP